MATDYSYLPIWLTKIWKYLREKLIFLLFLTGDLLGIVCCLSAFNREEDVVFGYVHFVHQDTWKLFDICVKCTEMGVIWLFFPPGFVYTQIMKKVASQQGLSFWVFRGPRQVMISVKFQ